MAITGSSDQHSALVEKANKLYIATNLSAHACLVSLDVCARRSLLLVLRGYGILPLERTCRSAGSRGHSASCLDCPILILSLSGVHTGTCTPHMLNHGGLAKPHCAVGQKRRASPTHLLCTYFRVSLGKPPPPNTFSSPRISVSGGELGKPMQKCACGSQVADVLC